MFGCHVVKGFQEAFSFTFILELLNEERMFHVVGVEREHCCARTVCGKGMSSDLKIIEPNQNRNALEIGKHYPPKKGFKKKLKKNGGAPNRLAALGALGTALRVLC
jgi:hypothetical protein